MVNCTGIVTLISVNLKQAKAPRAVSQSFDPGNRERHFIQADSCRAAVPSEASFPLKGYFDQELHKGQRKSVSSDPQRALIVVAELEPRGFETRSAIELVEDRLCSPLILEVIMLSMTEPEDS